MNLSETLAKLADDKSDAADNAKRKEDAFAAATAERYRKALGMGTKASPQSVMNLMSDPLHEHVRAELKNLPAETTEYSVRNKGVVSTQAATGKGPDTSIWDAPRRAVANISEGHLPWRDRSMTDADVAFAKKRSDITDPPKPKPPPPPLRLTPPPGGSIEAYPDAENNPEYKKLLAEKAKNVAPKKIWSTDDAIAGDIPQNGTGVEAKPAEVKPEPVNRQADYTPRIKFSRPPEKVVPSPDEGLGTSFK